MPEPDSFKLVTIDGGAAAGKSSTSRALADQLGLMHVDTGAHYRTLTYALLAAGAQPQNESAISDCLQTIDLGTSILGQTAHLSIQGKVPANDAIRSPEVNTHVSQFAAIAAVRSYLFDYQRSQVQVAQDNGFKGLIMEGRDIGSVIFPEAKLRFFLFADEATRAARRALEGQSDSIAERDKRDSQRKTAPLVCPEGATRIDTGPLSLDEVVAIITQHILA